jgi:amino acid transporter
MIAVRGLPGRQIAEWRAYRPQRHARVVTNLECTAAASGPGVRTFRPHRPLPEPHSESWPLSAMTTDYSIPAVIDGPVRQRAEPTGIVRWLLANQVHPAGPEAPEGTEQTNPWWKVMCLTGVDYFSTLSYLPGIAALAAGALSPIATLLVVLITLLGMLPMYRRIAEESPHGQGSVAMLERLLPFWRGKIFVLVLLGFVATSWIITITLSSADATVHLLQNPLAPEFLRGQGVVVTIVLLLILGGVFLLGFSEAVKVAIPLVGLFLLLNAVIVVAGLVDVFSHPDLLAGWTNRLADAGQGFGGVVGPAVVAFPLLVLGLSGFETGVSMMPLIAAGGETAAERTAARLRNTRRLLTTAALIMSVYLLATSFITTVLIPAHEFEAGGQASGRALAFLAHELFGATFGTIYDLSSVLILWFAGASAMAGLINIVPRYLPSYGMAPDWGKAVRPVVLVFTTVSILITIIFQAGVEAQAGAYATGILAMMVSGAVAVTVSAVRKRQRIQIAGFTVLTLILFYALTMNVLAEPHGITISAGFIGGIILISTVSRVARSTELRVDRIKFDDEARRLITQSIAFDGQLNIIANKRQAGDPDDYAEKEARQRRLNAVPGTSDVLFLEVEVIDPSSFGRVLHVRGIEAGGHRVLQVRSPAAPNAIAAILVALREATGLIPAGYFDWSEGHPASNLLRYFLLGRGDTPVMVREILREHDADPDVRPVIHVV